MTRPTSSRAHTERVIDTTIIWLGEWMKDVDASLDVIHGTLSLDKAEFEEVMQAVMLARTNVQRAIDKMEAME